jgi:hypothetical protein
LVIIVIVRDVEEGLFWGGRSREGVERRKGTWATVVGEGYWRTRGDVGHSEGVIVIAEEGHRRKDAKTSQVIISSQVLSGPPSPTHGLSHGHPDVISSSPFFPSLLTHPATALLLRLSKHPHTLYSISHHPFPVNFHPAARSCTLPTCARKITRAWPDPDQNMSSTLLPLHSRLYSVPSQDHYVSHSFFSSEFDAPFLSRHT